MVGDAGQRIGVVEGRAPRVLRDLFHACLVGVSLLGFLLLGCGYSLLRPPGVGAGTVERARGKALGGDGIDGHLGRGEQSICLADFLLIVALHAEGVRQGGIGEDNDRKRA